MKADFSRLRKKRKGLVIHGKLREAQGEKELHKKKLGSDTERRT